MFNNQNMLYTIRSDLKLNTPYIAFESVDDGRLRVRRSQRRSREFQKQAFDKSSSFRARRKPDFYTAVLPPQLHGSLSNMSELNPGKLDISQGIDFIDKSNLISGVISQKFGNNVFSDPRSGHGLIEKLAKSGSNSGSITRYPKTKGKSLLKSFGVGTRGTSIDKNKSGQGQGKVRKLGDKTQTDFNSDGNVNFMTPVAFVGSHNQNDDMKNVFLQNFMPHAKYKNPIMLDSQIDKNKHLTESKSFSPFEETGVDIPDLSKDVITRDKTFLERQQVAYKDSHIIHPLDSPSHYPAYPVYEEAHVTSDMKVLGTLLRNLHATEKRVQSLLNG